nr:hypothetical protein [Tanacetum cinerariifolium]
MKILPITSPLLIVIILTTLATTSYSSTDNNHLAVFRPKVDEISLLTINNTNFQPGFAFSLGGVRDIKLSMDAFDLLLIIQK